MHERVISDLNKLIIRQEALVESYARMIEDVEDEDLKEILKTVQENHFRQMMVISDRLMELGGEPRFQTGISGIMDDMRHHRKKNSDITDLENARIAVDGEHNDIGKLSGFEFGEIDPTSLELLQSTVNQDQENIKALEEYIQRIDTLS